MNEEVDVSIIIPVLKPSNDFLRCLYSIRTALEGQVKYYIICVVRDVDAFSEYWGSDICFVNEDEPGIYGAMNKGICEARGRYMYFIGQDDVLLPTSAKAITQGLKGCADLILADVFWGSNGVFKNNPDKHSLVWRNWCHQGVFYNRLKFDKEVGEYSVQFKVQADHYANILFSNISGLKTFKYDGCVAWYASDGFSSRFLDKKFRAAFPEIVRRNFGEFFFYVVVVRRAMLEITKLIRRMQ